MTGKQKSRRGPPENLKEKKQVLFVIINLGREYTEKPQVFLLTFYGKFARCYLELICIMILPLAVFGEFKIHNSISNESYRRI